ncbi:MAG: hypothetical protein R2713_12780 [Ilumatobacteraceae bacterium]
MAQAIIRIGLQYYITARRFYHGEQSLGRQARAARRARREMAKADGGGTGLFAQAKRDLAAAKEGNGAKPAPARARAASPPPASPPPAARRQPPKGKPTPTGRTSRPPSSGKAAKPNSSAPRSPKQK